MLDGSTAELGETKIGTSKEEGVKGGDCDGSKLALIFSSKCNLSLNNLFKGANMPFGLCFQFSVGEELLPILF